MDNRILKLQRLGIDSGVAEKLVMGGFSTPRKIKAATDRALRAIPGIGAATVATLRERFSGD